MLPSCQPEPESYGSKSSFREQIQRKDKRDQETPSETREKEKKTGKRTRSTTVSRQRMHSKGKRDVAVQSILSMGKTH